MKRIIPILMALLLLSGCATQSAKKTYRQITMEEAVTMLEEETGYTILDVRTAQEYSEKHIPGAINIANESIGTEDIPEPVSYTHLRAHETDSYLVCRLLLEKKKKKKT